MKNATATPAPSHPVWCRPALCKDLGSDIVHAGFPITCELLDDSDDFMSFGLIQSDERTDDGQVIHPPEVRIVTGAARHYMAADRFAVLMPAVGALFDQIER